MTTFRDRSRRTTTGLNRKGGGGARGSWSDEVRIPNLPPKTDGIPLLFINGDYVNPQTDDGGTWDEHAPYYVYLQAKAVIREGNTLQGMRTDCVPGAWKRPEGYPQADSRVYDQGHKPHTIWGWLKSKGDSRVGFSTRAAFNVIDLRPHHEVPKLDKEGHIVKFTHGEKAGTPVMERKPCEGEDCEHCADDIKVTVGRKGYLDVGSKHRDEIMDLELLVDDYCRACQEGEISRVAFICPECNEVMIDLTEAKLKADEEERIYLGGMKCPNCKTPKALPIEEVECSKCKNPSRATLADVVFFARKTGKDKDTSIGAFRKGLNARGWMWLTEYELSNGELLASDVDVKTDDGTVSVTYAFDKSVKEMLRPYDFSTMRGVGVPGQKNKNIAKFLGVSGLPDELQDEEGDDDGDGEESGNKGGGSQRRPQGRFSGRRTGASTRY